MEFLPEAKNFYASSSTSFFSSHLISSYIPSDMSMASSLLSTLYLASSLNYTYCYPSLLSLCYHIFLSSPLSTPLSYSFTLSLLCNHACISFSYPPISYRPLLSTSLISLSSLLFLSPSQYLL